MLFIFFEEIRGKQLPGRHIFSGNGCLRIDSSPFWILSSVINLGQQISSHQKHLILMIITETIKEKRGGCLNPVTTPLRLLT
jgi:hypothetical protein